MPHPDLLTEQTQELPPYYHALGLGTAEERRALTATTSLLPRGGDVTPTEGRQHGSHTAFLAYVDQKNRTRSLEIFYEIEVACPRVCEWRRETALP